MPLASNTSTWGFRFIVPLIPVGLLVLEGCKTPTRLRVQERFVDTSAPDDNGYGRVNGTVVGSASVPEVRDVVIHGDRRPSLVVGAPARIRFRSSESASAFRFALGVRPPDAQLSVRLLANGQLVHDERWQAERGWVERTVDLTSSSEPLELELSLEGRGAQVMLAHPELVSPARNRHPNVLLYVIDCLRADHVGAYGYDLATTPELDRLATQSMILEDLNACAPWTKPSTACLFTSLLPIDHGARTVDDALSLELTTLAEVFQREGYTTAAWVANPVIDPRVFSFNQGFDRWVDLRSFEERAGRSHVNPLISDAADITKEFTAWLSEHHNDTFFVYLHSLDLHFGYRPRPPFDELFVSDDSEGIDRERELYDNELAYNDREVGKIISKLKELGLFEDTLILITSDHGEEFGEHGSTRHGKTLYQTLLHVPGVLKFPGGQFAGRRLPAAVSNIDLAPTLLEVAGIEPPDAFQGESVLPLVHRGTLESSRLLFAELIAPNVVAYAIRENRYKYIRSLVPKTYDELFDLNSDPQETRSLLGESLAVERNLMAKLERFIVLGQHGLHLSLRGKRTGVKTEIRVVTDAEISEAFRFAMVTGDVMETSADGKRVTLTFTTDERRRHVVLRSVPEGAPVRIEIFEDGRRLSTEALRGGPQASLVSQPLDPLEVTVSMAEAESLLHRTQTAYMAWYVPPHARGNPVELDEETVRTLRALGYIE